MARQQRIRHWVSGPLAVDEFNVFVVRYDFEEDNPAEAESWYLNRDGGWCSIPVGGVLEPYLTVPGLLANYLPWLQNAFLDQINAVRDECERVERAVFG